MTYASLVSCFAFDVTKSRVFEGHFCLVIFSRFSRFSSATQHLKTRIKDLSTSNQTDSTVCSCLHLYAGLPGFQEANSPQLWPPPLHHRYAVWFVSLPEAQEAPPKECKQLHAVESVWLEVFKSLNHVLRRCVALLNLKNLKR